MIRAGLPGRPTTELRRRLELLRELAAAEPPPSPVLHPVRTLTYAEAIAVAVDRARFTGRRQRVERARLSGGYRVQEVSA